MNWTHLRSRAPIAALSMVVAAVAMTASPRMIRAQMPTLPVLQSGFAGSGMTLAVNYGSGTSSNAYAIAAGWGPASGRFQVSGAIGGVRPDTGSTWTGYGFRAAVPLYSAMADRFGVALFAGVGGARRDTTSVVHVPAGVGVGYRMPLGATRSIAAYASPFFVWSRVSEKGARAEADNRMRGSFAADIVLTRNFGLTAGYEFGASGSEGSGKGIPGTSKGLFGAAVSYAFR